MGKTYRYQWRVLTILFLTWGVTGLARNSIAYLFPYFSLEFGLSAQHAGFLAATVAFFWATSIIICGNLAGKIGQIKVVASGLIFGALSLMLFGFSHQVMLLYLFAACFGFGCGAMCAPSIAMVAEQSNPKNRGMCMGIMQSGYTLIGFAIGAVVLTQMGGITGWRSCYGLMGGLIAVMAVVFWFSLRHVPGTQSKQEPDQAAQSAEKYALKDIWVYRNIKITTCLACLAMMWSFTMAAFAIIYLIDSRGFDTVTAGAIFAGFGLGGFCGEVFIPMLSDFLGRKRTIMLCSLVGFVGFLAFLLLHAGPVVLTAIIFVTALAVSGIMPIMISIIPSEAVPEHLIATATSFTPAVGEMVGGVLSPALAGIVSGLVGISNVMLGLTVVPVIIFVGVFFLQETAPRVVAKNC